MNDIKLAAKLDGVTGGQLRIVGYSRGYVVIVAPHFHSCPFGSNDLIALSRAVCEAAGLRVVETEAHERIEDQFPIKEPMVRYDGPSKYRMEGGAK